MMRHALILGASGDIGTAIANHLAAQGWSLYLHGFHHRTKVETLIQTLQTAYPKQDFIGVYGNLAEVSEIDQLLTNLFEVDSLVIASGITNYGLYAQTPFDEVQELMSIQLTGPLYLIQQLEGKLSRSGHGRILFIGSVYGDVGSAMEVIYSTVKGAQSAFAKAYALEVASLGITVNVLAPGAVETQMNRQFSDQDHAAITDQIPVHRFARPQEIAYFVANILAEEAGYLTGQTIYLTGGWLK